MTRPPLVGARQRHTAWLRPLQGVLVGGVLVVVATAGLAVVPTRAAAEPATGDDAAGVAEARQRFQDGIAHVKAAEWAQALDEFERSAALRPHAVTSYNKGACLRAMGRYTRARVELEDARGRNTANPGELPAQLARETDTFLAEIDGLLGRIELRLSPADARIAIDGAPLAVATDGQHAVAGVRAGGKGDPAPGARFVVDLDPGPHVMILSRPGYRDVVINRAVPPGSRETMPLALDELPARIQVNANTDQAVVEMDGQLLGFAPINIERPQGTHVVRVRQDGYEPYETEVRVKAGEQATLRATLVEEQPSVFERWWFWTAAGVAVTGAVVITYVATRPAAERPPLDGGGFGWVVPIE